MFGAVSESHEAWSSTIPATGDDAIVPALPAAAPVSTMEQQAAPVVAMQPATTAADRRGAGLGVVFAGAGVAVGWLLAGGLGAGAGLLLVGAVRNGLRAQRLWSTAQPGDREEAAKSATMAALGAGVGGYLAYRAVRARNGITAEE